MPVADEFWLLAHDDVKGRPRLSTGVLGLGLAAALLGELVEHRAVGFQQGQVQLVAGADPADPLARTLLAEMFAEPPHPIRVWLVYLSRTADQRVAERLVGEGLLRRDSSRRLLKQVTTYQPCDANRAAWPLARLSTTLGRQSPMAEADTFLAALTVATGLDQLILRDAGHPGAPDYLTHLVTNLAAPYHELFSHTQAAVGDAVLSRRA